MRHIPDEPADRYLLEPLARAGEERASPEEPIVPMSERPECTACSGAFEFGGWDSRLAVSDGARSPGRVPGGSLCHKIFISDGESKSLNSIPDKL